MDWRKIIIAVAGVALLGVLILAAVAGYYRAKQGAAPIRQDQPITQDQRQQLIEQGTATAPSTLTTEQKTELIQAGTAAQPSSLTPEQRQALIDAGTAH